MSWRFAVSTLGMPGVPAKEAARVATEHGCHGLELRVYPGEEVHLGLAGAEVDRVRGQIADAGLVVACLAGYPKVCAPGPDGPVVAELRALIELAQRLDAPAVRVFPGGGGGGDGSDHGDGAAHDRIGAVLDDLRGSGVQLLVETHDSHPTGEAALRLVEPFAAPNQVSVLWDALHPWRHGEAPVRTRAVLGEYLGYFQIKDAEGPHDRTPVPPGQGGVPLAECGELLRNWSGWVSLEWEKAWYPEIAPVTVPLRAAAAWFAQWATDSR